MTALLGIGLFDAICWLIVLPALCVLGYRAYEHSESRGPLLVKWIISALLIVLIRFITYLNVPFTPILIILPAGILGVMWAPCIGAFVSRPLTGAIDGGGEEVEPKPFYFIAEAHRRKGLFEEAIAELRKQLEKFPGDVEGMMRLATLQAEDMHDLPGAEATIAELLQQPGLPSNAAVAALQTLADWQLQIGRNAAAARASLERVVQMFPNSSFAHAAEQRLAHLAGVEKTRQFREQTVFKVPAGERDIGLRPAAKPAQDSMRAEADARAAEYVRQLEEHPNDTETRERLALLYAEQFQRVDLAADQLEQLTTFPNETPAHIARWLDLLATVHVRYGRNLEAAEGALRRIMERFPNTALASRAEGRLTMLPIELKAGQATVFKPLGVYEKDLGLKAGSTWKPKS
jgi:outer membrane protein assembly factor BamD (BamD/ComL family)